MYSGKNASRFHKLMNIDDNMFLEDQDYYNDFWRTLWHWRPI